MKMKPAFEQRMELWSGTNFFEFRVGTVTGLYRYSIADHAFEILAIKNKIKGNGHFKVAMDYFEQSARREKAILRLCEVFNPRLYWNSVVHHGYRRKKGTILTLEKTPLDSR